MLLTDFRINHILIQISFTLLKPIKKKILLSYAFTFQWESFNGQNIYTRSLLDRIISLKICNCYSNVLLPLFSSFWHKNTNFFFLQGYKKEQNSAAFVLGVLPNRWQWRWKWVVVNIFFDNKFFSSSLWLVFWFALECHQILLGIFIKLVKHHAQSPTGHV